MSTDRFGCYSEDWRGATGIYLVPARDVAKYPTMHGTTPSTKNDLASNVNSAEVEKPRSSWSLHQPVCLSNHNEQIPSAGAH